MARSVHRFAAGTLAAGLLAGTGLFASSATAGSSPAIGGELVVGWTNLASGLDPHTPIHSGEPPYTWLIYDKLTDVDDDLEVVPMLAESWEYTDDSSALVMTLRDDAMFQDGTPVTAEAAALSLTRAIELEGSTVAASLESVAGVEATDEQTLRIDLVEGRGAELPAVLATSAGIVINPVALESGQDLATDSTGAGSGPYVLESFEPNATAVFTRRPDGHWDPLAGRLDRLEIQNVAANDARYNGVVSGELDLTQVSVPLLTDAMDQIESGEFGGRMVEGFSQYTLFLNASVPPFDDVNVRRAMNAAIDRDAISEELFEGGCRATSQPFPANISVHNPQVETDTVFDLELAASLLADAETADPSFGVGFIPGSTAFESIATVVQGWWDEAGIQSELLPVPSSELLAGFRSGTYSAVYNSLIAKPHAALMVSDFYLDGFNLIPADAPERPELEELAAQGVDPQLSKEERDAAYQEFWAIVADAAYSMPVCFLNQVWLHSNDVAGIDMTHWLWGGSPDLRYLATA